MRPIFTTVSADAAPAAITTAAAKIPAKRIRPSCRRSFMLDAVSFRKLRLAETVGAGILARSSRSRLRRRGDGSPPLALPRDHARAGAAVPLWADRLGHCLLVQRLA